MNQRPPIAPRTVTRTYYPRPALDRWTGRYVVAWETPEGPRSIRVHNRFVDFEGHTPSLRSVLGLPHVVRTYREARKHGLLARPLPFLNYDAIRHLARLAQPGTSVVEYGGGNSTLWLLARGVRVITIEHDAEWCEALLHAAMARGLDEHLTLHCLAGDAAVDVVRSLPDGALDGLLVDCKNEHTWRYDCVAAGRDKVRSGGWICVDNSDHPNNWPAVDLLQDLPRRRFTGFGPMCAVVTQTSFWVR